MFRSCHQLFVKQIHTDGTQIVTHASDDRSYSGDTFMFFFNLQVTSDNLRHHSHPQSTTLYLVFTIHSRVLWIWISSSQSQEQQSLIAPPHYHYQYHSFLILVVQALLLHSPCTFILLLQEHHPRCASWSLRMLSSAGVVDFGICLPLTATGVDARFRTKGED